MATKSAVTTVETDPSDANGSGDYVLPVLHAHIPRPVVDAGFWGGLTGAVVLGAIDPPLGLLVGAGVLVARHRGSA